MAERGSKAGILIVVGVVVLGLGGIAAWLFWWNPRQERQEAQAQVRAWEARWQPARTCILGDPPLAADAGDALALAELASGSLASNAADCTRLVSSITRPEGAAVTDEVERAFAEVQAAIPAVAKAYAFRISADADEIDRRVAELGVAITALDAAHDRLRAVAGLDALERGGAAVLRRTPDPIPLVVDQRPLPVENAGRIQAGVIEGARWGEDAVFYAMTGPGTVREVRSAVDALPALPASTWMAAAMPARAFDQRAVEGALVPVAMPTADRLDHAAAVPVAPPHFIPVGALGAGAERSVVLVPDRSTGALPAKTPPFQLAASTDGGKTWAPIVPAEVLPGVVAYTDWNLARGTLTLVLHPADGVSPDRWYRFDAARPAEIPAPVAVTELDLDGSCQRGGTVWWLGDARVFRLAAPEVTELAAPAGGDLRLLDCTSEAALLEEGSMPVRYHRCRAGACAEAFRGSTYAYGRAAMLDDGAVVYAAGRGAVIALWKEGVPDPTYFRMPRPFTLHALVVWDGMPHALVHAPEDRARLLLAVPLAAP